MAANRTSDMENFPAVMAVAQLRVFVAPHAQGNPALCVIAAGRPRRAQLRHWGERAGMTLCVGWRRGNVLLARCYQRGRRVQFCGHGLLAIAALWQRLHSEKFAENERHSPIALHSGGKDLTVESFDDLFWLRVSRPRCEARKSLRADSTPWSISPVAETLCGGPEGYRIWEWAPGTDIAKLTVERSFLLRDKRATILTARAACGEMTYSLRYLAPQYGIDEDAATGSANVVLADYWRRQQLPPPYVAHQCSPQGGLLHVDVDPHDVWIGGAIEIGALIDADAFAQSPARY